MSGSLHGKRALITGGHRGIGRAIAEAFTEAGAVVAIADIEGADVAAKEIGRGAIGVTCDVSSADSVAAAVQTTTASLGGIDVLVNNAGVEAIGPLHETSEADFDRLMAINVRGPWLVYKHAVPALIDGGGAIVNIASVSGVAAFPLLGVYSATKAALIRLTEAMTLELRDHGVRATAICPGLVNTEMVARTSDVFADITGASFAEVVTQGQGEMAAPADIAGLATYLASDAASFVNGTAIVVDGGMNLRRV